MMDELFEKLERGEVPNVLEIMSALSELSEFWPGDVCLDCRVSPDSEFTPSASPESTFS